MLLKKITTHNYQNLGTQEFNFDGINLIKGRNGIGKSNLSIHALTFCLFGYTYKYKLTELKTRGIKDKECWVESTIEHEGIIYTIKREIPTLITIKQDNINIDPKNKMSNADKEEFLCKLFHTVSWFKQFRLIDAYDKDETNFLEKSDITIKKILFAGHESRLNNVRERLLEIKLERENHNRDDVVLYTHFPSIKRLKIMQQAIAGIEDKIDIINDIIEQQQEEHNNYLSDKSEKEGKKNYLSKFEQKLASYSYCPFCKRKLDEELKKELLVKTQGQIQDLVLDIVDLKEKMDEYSQKITQQETKQDKMRGKRETLNELIMKLESRLHNKEYKYTKKDILIAKQAIDEINRISSHYLRQSVKVLEPIINQVLQPIRHTLSFEVDEKERFKIVLTDDKGREWKYLHLSTGQKLLLQISFKMAILLDRGEEGLLVADEGFGSLDITNLQHIMEIVNQFPFQLIMILHRFDNVPNYVNVIDLDKERK